eukprot:CAMPEP_0201492184 /NCGR_PEP_ID=MMETSP0151_2-20130828/32126_1 /ASSEMBLY_ACC=CAM_ASM_000257 /TAXON_ID=200890 /ORGANISM="Paramoeba atlantica, Strain 621/1 / CCAP 1560/9" /LENGTH=365 /DNA_ID=CAMNT_0047878863 /DNA_START=34 /DNA_END=1131 /DNA_ORIENTATION=+
MTDQVIYQILDRKNYYQVLGIPDFSNDLTLLKENYRKLCVIVHPDKCQHELAGDAFKRVAEAYGCLSGASSKIRYDARLVLETVQKEKVKPPSKQFGVQNSRSKLPSSANRRKNLKVRKFHNTSFTIDIDLCMKNFQETGSVNSSLEPLIHPAPKVTSPPTTFGPTPSPESLTQPPIPKFPQNEDSTDSQKEPSSSPQFSPFPSHSEPDLNGIDFLKSHLNSQFVGPSLFSQESCPLLRSPERVPPFFERSRRKPVSPTAKSPESPESPESPDLGQKSTFFFEHSSSFVSSLSCPSVETEASSLTRFSSSSLVSGDSEFLEVENVEAKKEVFGSTHYLVKWKGMSVVYNSWVDSGCLSSVKDPIE